MEQNRDLPHTSISSRTVPVTPESENSAVLVSQVNRAAGVRKQQVPAFEVNTEVWDICLHLSRTLKN